MTERAPTGVSSKGRAADALKMLTPDELAAALQVSPATIDQWRWLRKGPEWVRIGRHVRYRAAAVDAWLAAGADNTPADRAKQARS